MPYPIDNTFRRITVLWLVSLAAVALLALSSDFLFGSAVNRSEAYADVVNTAGRQRMLSQQVALHSTLYVNAQSALARETYARRLDQAVRTMRVEHESLVANARINTGLLPIYEEEGGINDLNTAYWEVAERLLAVPADEISPLEPSYLYLIENSQFVLSKLDTAVRAILDESIAAANTLHQVNNLRLLVVSSLIAAQYFFVFRPTMARLRGRANALEREISERKRVESELRASEARFRSLAETAPVGIFQSDLNDSMIWVNRRWQELMNLSGEDAYGRTWAETIHPEDMPRIMSEAREQRASGNPLLMMDYRIVRRDGVTLDLHATSTAEVAENGEKTGYIGTIMDITQRKLAEDRALKLEAERQRIRVLGQFIRDTSHDLRTPLTVIKSGLYFCRRLTDVEKIHERAATIEQYVNYLNIVIDQLQDMAVLDTLTDLTLMPMDITLLIRDVARSVSERADAANKTFTLDIGDDLPQVRVAPEKLISALNAVLDNARRYTGDGGQIRMSAAARNGHLIIAVADNGIGIEAENLPHVFERFYKVDKARSIGGGAGLGLPIAKRVMDLHSGDITISSVFGAGTAVEMRFSAVPHQ